MNNSGYTTILIDGETIGLRFGIHAVRTFLDKMGGDEQLIADGTVNELGIANLLYCGYINNQIANDASIDKKLGAFICYVEDCVLNEQGRDKLTEVVNTYSESKYTKRVIEGAKEAAEAIKKKTI